MVKKGEMVERLDMTPLAVNADWTQLTNTLFPGEFGDSTPWKRITRVGVDPVVGDRVPKLAMSRQDECRRPMRTMIELNGCVKTIDKMLRKRFIRGPCGRPLAIQHAPMKGVDKWKYDGSLMPFGRPVLDNTCEAVLGDDGMNSTGWCLSMTHDPQAAAFESRAAECEQGLISGSDQSGAFHSHKFAFA